MKLMHAFCFLLPITAWISAGAQTELEESIFGDTEFAVPATVLEELEGYRRQPVNLNSCSLRRLLALPFLTPVSARAIYRERRMHGAFISWNDFAERLSGVLDEIEVLRTVVCFRNRNASGSIHARSRFTKAVKKPGTDSPEPGSRFALRERVTITSPHRFSAAFLIEKDSGETSFADHVAGYASWTMVSHHLTLLVGDYSVESGQGLSGWGPYAAPKGSEPGSHLLKQAGDIRGYASGDENRFLRGTAVSGLLGPFRLAGFASFRHLDAVISDEGNVTSTPTSGLHISAAEQRNKDRLQETVCGGMLEYRFSAGCIGTTVSKTKYGTPFGGNTRKDGYFAFQGTVNTVGGCHVLLDLPLCSAAGEIARSSSGGRAWLLTLFARSSLLPLVISAHRFGPDFHNPRSNGAGISPAENDYGFHLALSRPLLGKDRISWYYDMGGTPWRTYTLPAVNRWNEQFLEYRTNLTGSLRLRGRIRLKQGRSARAALLETDPAERTGERLQTQYRLEATWRYARAARLQARFEFTRIRYRFFGDRNNDCTPLRGRLFYISWKYSGIKNWRITSRFTFFDTDGWDARIYLFENSVPGTMSVTALSGKGTAWISSLSCTLGSRLNICASLSLQANGPRFKHPTKRTTVLRCQTDLSL